mgnify:CR=1 FL=1
MTLYGGIEGGVIILSVAVGKSSIGWGIVALLSKFSLVLPP